MSALLRKLQLTFPAVSSTHFFQIMRRNNFTCWRNRHPHKEHKSLWCKLWEINILTMTLLVTAKIHIEKEYGIWVVPEPSKQHKSFMGSASLSLFLMLKSYIFHFPLLYFSLTFSLKQLGSHFPWKDPTRTNQYFNSSDTQGGIYLATRAVSDCVWQSGRGEVSSRFLKKVFTGQKLTQNNRN